MTSEVERRLFQALNGTITRSLLGHGEFLLQDEYFQPNDAKFIYRCPSLRLVNQFEIYLEEDLPIPSFQLHFQWLQPSRLLCVTVDVVLKESFPVVGTELGDPHCSWQRLMGLPSALDHSMVDVWHLDDALAARIIAETKYSDVFPRFQSLARKQKRNGEDGDDDAEGGDKKGEEHDDDADDDDDAAGQDGDGENDDMIRRAPGSAKKKRRKNLVADPAENDESITPVSPDTHVNTPEPSGTIVRMQFPNDSDLDLHTDAQVHHFKRRRKSTMKNNSDPKNASSLALTFGSSASYSPAMPAESPNTTPSLTSLQAPSMELVASMKHGATNSPAAPMRRPSIPTASPNGEPKPTLSVAVSLVASLSHDEQQEVLDIRPIKTHPMLEALQVYVEQELASSLAAESKKQVLEKTKTVSTSLAYYPSDPYKTPLRLSTNNSTANRLQNNLLGDRFKPWRSDYSPLQYHKKSRQHRRERDRQLLLSFDQDTFEETARAQAREVVEDLSIRDQEIALGIQMAAKDVMVPWIQGPGSESNWSVHPQRDTRIARERDQNVLAKRVEPYLQLVRTHNSKKPEATEQSSAKCWLTFKQYASACSSADDAALMEESVITVPPKFCVATEDSSYHVDAPVISEYLLRNLHPVASPKPVDYVIVCPHSPSEWLGTLALSYITCFRSMYAQCHMGDHAPIDLSGVDGTPDVSVDIANALMLIDCATRTQDAFATYRAAGELLNPLVSNGVKKMQAFSRSAVANVVYVVVPFGRKDMKHKMWALGAFWRGLCGGAKLDEVAWRESVTVEFVCLEDLYEVNVNPSPFVLMPSCFGLYDRVYESTVLKPAEKLPGAAPAASTRHVSERLYHLADWRVPSDSESAVPCVYGGYLISEDRKWLACSCVDSVGSLLETYTIPLDEHDIASGLLAMMDKWLSFLALFGERANLVITSLGAKDSVMDEQEWKIWVDLRELIPSKYTPLLAQVLLVHVNVVSSKAAQVRRTDQSALYHNNTLGYVVIAPLDDASIREASRAAPSGVVSSFAPTKESMILRVHLLQDLLSDEETTRDKEQDAKLLGAIVRDLHALSYLTMQPVTMERQSPLPLHLAVIDRTRRELLVLQTQLTHDPLELQAQQTASSSMCCG